MSEPSYRITTEHKPTNTFCPWEARIVRLTDGMAIATEFGMTENAAIEAAARRIRDVSQPLQPGRVVFADEDGQITHGGVPEPGSLRA